MAEDIAPKLLESIQNIFNEKIHTDPLIDSLTKKIEDENATLRDGYKYSMRLSELATESIYSVLNSDNLPDGKLYWSIAEGTIMPFFRDVHEMIIDYEVAATIYEDRKLGIEIQCIRPAFNEARLRKIINTLVCDPIEDNE